MTRATTPVSDGVRLPSEAGRLPISSPEDIVRVRQSVRAVAVAVRLPLVAQTKLVTATSELARNTLVHGGGGYAAVEHRRDGSREGVRVRFVDSGPGIADLRLALTDGYTSKDGLGLGLSGSRRLVDEFDINTAPARGTTVTVTTWAH